MTPYGEVLTGRLAPHPELGHPRLKLGDVLLEGYTTTVPDTVDWISAVPTWPVYSNDRIRDCCAAAAAHAEEAWSYYGAGAAVMVTDTDVVRFYQQISGYNPLDPTTDRGAVMQDALGVWRKIGIAGHRILGFAQVDPTNQPECKAALAWFGALYVGVHLPASAVTQTRVGAPWSFDTTADNRILGGHAIHVGACDPTGMWTGTTWGRTQRIQPAWWAQYVEEAWVPLTGEWITKQGTSPTGLDIKELNARFTQLTKEPGPFPVPADPSPAPAPAPKPATDPDTRLITQCWPWATKKHWAGAGKIAEALLEWRKQKGL